MKVKEGDIVEFISLEWRELEWEFDHPTMLLEPFVRYYNDGTSNEAVIEDACINLMCGDDCQDEDLGWTREFYRWNMSTLNRVAKKRLSGLDYGKMKSYQVMRQKVKFVMKNDRLEFEILETKEF